MICPNCKKPMIVVEQHQIELDYCPDCRGVWFDVGELELLVESEALSGPQLDMEHILDLPDVSSPRHLRRCPICRSSMKEVAIGDPVINIDVCRLGDGLWFDGGEIPALLRQMTGSGGRVIDFLGDVFRGEE